MSALRRARHNLAALSPTATPSLALPTPSVVPVDWPTVLQRDFKNTGVIDLNEGQSEAEILADPGLYHAGMARYRDPNYQPARFTTVGIPGFGFDVAVDHHAAGHTLEYLIERPNGEIEPRPGEGIYCWNRPSTGPAMTALLNSQFGAVNNNTAYGAPLRCAALLTTYLKANAAPPFARTTWFIANNDATMKAFIAAMWSTEDGNHAYPNDRRVSPTEMDDHELLGVGTNNRDNTSSFHASGADLSYASWNSGNNVGKLVGVCSVLSTTDLKTYYSLNPAAPGPTWTLAGTLLVSSMGSSLYAQLHTALIHNICGGFFWQGAAGIATDDLSFVLVQSQLNVPATNPNYTVPSVTPPGEVLLAWDGAYATDIPENKRGRVGLLTLPAGVTSVRVNTAAGRFAAVGNELHVVQPLYASQQPTAKLQLIGVKEDGAKSVGRVWSKPVSAVSGYSPFTPRTGAAIDIDPVAGFASNGGVTIDIATVCTVAAGAYNLIGPALAFLNRASGTWVIEFTYNGPSAVSVMAVLSTTGALSELNVNQAGTAATFNAGGDRALTLAAPPLPTLNKAGVSWGAAGTMGAINANTPVSVANLHTAAGASARAGASINGDRDGLTVTRMTFYADANRITAAALTARLA